MTFDKAIELLDKAKLNSRSELMGSSTRRVGVLVSPRPVMEPAGADAGSPYPQSEPPSAS
jgi:hypothetical protein